MMMIKTKNKAALILICAICSFGGIVYLVLYELQSSIEYFITPSQLPERGGAVTLGGSIIEGSLKNEDNYIQFQISDGQNSVVVHASESQLPELFPRARELVMHGIFDAENQVFIAKKVFLRHDEKYSSSHLKY